MAKKRNLIIKKTKCSKNSDGVKGIENQQDEEKDKYNREDKESAKMETLGGREFSTRYQSQLLKKREIKEVEKKQNKQLEYVQMKNRFEQHSLNYPPLCWAVCNRILTQI